MKRDHIRLAILIAAVAVFAYAPFGCGSCPTCPRTSMGPGGVHYAPGHERKAKTQTYLNLINHSTLPYDADREMARRDWHAEGEQ